ncbi:MAG: PP2C family protein-serine/threonine phosphatase [Longimicrobiales bacterium]
MNWESVALTHPGLRRNRNEDTHLFRPERQLFAVADGMGGHAAGDVASRIAIEVVDALFAASPAPGTEPSDVARRLLAIAERANSEICARADAEPEKEGMGTTLTVLVTLDDECVIAHIGDSRVYRMRSGTLAQLTTDHTWVQKQVAVGALTPLQARLHPYSSVLSRVLGVPDVGDADVLITDGIEGDIFLLCSDGLTSMVEDADLEAILAQPKPLPDLAEDLVASANKRGGYDNVTVILLRRTHA